MARLVGCVFLCCFFSCACPCALYLDAGSSGDPRIVTGPDGLKRVPVSPDNAERINVGQDHWAVWCIKLSTRAPERTRFDSMF